MLPCVGCVGVVLGGRCWHSPFPLAMACCDSRPGFCCLKSPSVVSLPSFRHPPLGHKWKYVAWNGSPRKDHEIRIPNRWFSLSPRDDSGLIQLPNSCRMRAPWMLCMRCASRYKTIAPSSHADQNSQYWDARQADHPVTQQQAIVTTCNNYDNYEKTNRH